MRFGFSDTRTVYSTSMSRCSYCASPSGDRMHAAAFMSEMGIYLVNQKGLLLV